jgi:hypothetical protein
MLCQWAEGIEEYKDGFQTRSRLINSGGNSKYNVNITVGNYNLVVFTDVRHKLYRVASHR